MKIIALYLPQFHRIAENDRWWGDGFTEWTNTRRAQPLFRGHYQPRCPLGDNYYDLSNVEVLEHQSRVARAYGIHGFCYYHYWFKGKLLLQGPTENMLRRSAHNDMPFCLSWANEPWTRTWSGKGQDVLMEQDYGSAADWRNHFDYLLQYFRDPRYITVGGKPIFLIYRTASIPNVNEMTDLWQALAISAGLKGLYLIETMNSFQKQAVIPASQAVMEFEPMFTLTHHYPKYLRAVARAKNLLFHHGLNIKAYSSVWRAIVQRPIGDYRGRKVIPGLFVDWDNSPRTGKCALILHLASPSVFGKYLRLQLKKAQDVYDSDLIFLNAWNEWGEGAYIEPDQRFGYGYLEQLSAALPK